MPCPLCGDICRCSSNAYSAAPPRWQADNDTRLLTPPPHAEPEAPGADAAPPPPTTQASVPIESNESAPEDSAAWRQEVASRFNRYQARRKPRPPRYPSLRLRFDNEDPALAPSSISADSSAFPRRAATASNQALALDGFADSIAHATESPASGPGELPQPASPPIAPTTPPITAPTATTAKIIEFPRSWTPPQSPLDELAEPVLDRDRPRILEAPEVVPPPPALGGITIEPAQRPEMEKRPGIDIPLQSAPLARRIFAAAVDGVIIAIACAFFGFIFWKITAIRPPRFQIMGLVVGLSGLFWAAYQYLLLVYAGTTPGLRLALLELAHFDGSPASRRLRRWRVLASFLSAASLGMGYAWVVLDEDSLCWHDRITHTYLAPKS
ncbi:MAG: RDD family protein [Candidatus Sulfotelmatobacter sp.]